MGLLDGWFPKKNINADDKELKAIKHPIRTRKLTKKQFDRMFPEEERKLVKTPTFGDVYGDLLLPGLYKMKDDIKKMNKSITEIINLLKVRK